MAQNKRTWAGGRAYDTADGRTRWTIRKLINGRPYFVTLGVETEVQAQAELALFLRDPPGYVASVEAKRSAPPTAPDAVVALDDVRVDAFLASLETKGRTKLYIADAKRYLACWDEALKGCDLRRLDSKGVKKMLEAWPRGRKYRTIIFKSFCGFLVDRGDLDPVENPGRFLKVASAKRKHETKGYTIPEVEALYSALSSQDVRDVLCLMSKTGMHWTEADRIARGTGTLRAVEDRRIAGTVTFPHKTGRLAKLSLDAQTLAAAQRLLARGSAVVIHAINDCVATAVKHNPKLRTINFGALRHSFATWLQEGGSVYTPTGRGVPIEVVKEALFHSTARTTSLHYLEGQIPALYCVPLTLTHADDPALPAKVPDTVPEGGRRHKNRAKVSRLRVIE